MCGSEMSFTVAPSALSHSRPWLHSFSISAGMPSMRYSRGTPMTRPLTPRSTAAAKSGTARLTLVESLASKPDMDVIISAASSTVRAIGPAWSSEEAKATVPQREQRP
ncbi:hypothetical protein D9M68_958510 [compost metagenome]